MFKKAGRLHPRRPASVIAGSQRWPLMTLPSCTFEPRPGLTAESTRLIII
jgi:hypothetical protein